MKSISNLLRKYSRRTGVCRLLSLLLVVCLLPFGVVACTEERPPIVTKDLQFVSAEGYSIYTIVYSETTATAEVIQAAHVLRDTMEAILDCEVGLTDDHVSQGTDYSYEILVGDVHRSVVPDIFSSLGEDEYTARVSGHKIVLLGEDNRATLEAVDHFIREILRCPDVNAPTKNTNVSISPEYCYDGVNSAPQEAVLKADSLLPISPYQPEELLLIDTPERTVDALTLGTLQGLAAMLSGEQILLNTDEIKENLSTLTAPAPIGYGAKVYTTDATGASWTLPLLLKHFASRLQGYILANEDLTASSAAVAISMAHQMQAVVVTPENEQLALDAGLSMVFDATLADMDWFYTSEYFDKIHRTVAVEQTPQLSPRLVDYAVMSGALFVAYNGEDTYLLAQSFRYLDDGAVVLGTNRVLGEYRMIQALASINACFLPVQQGFNLSVLSGFARDGVSLENTAAQSPSENAQKKHTVCLLMSDGESLDTVMNECISSESWYASSKRGQFAMNWGVPALIGELCHPALHTLASGRTDADSFFVQYSGTGATFPSLWRENSLSSMAAQLNRLMEDMGVSYLQVTDDGPVRADNFAYLAAQPAVDGIIYHDYNYAHMDGSIHWLGNVPVVSARYRLWAGLHEGSIAYIANAVNAAPTDPAVQDAYSVIFVHAWSGLDSEGHLTANGNTMDAVAALIAAFDDDVEVVGLEELMARIKQNVVH